MGIQKYFAGESMCAIFGKDYFISDPIPFNNHKSKSVMCDLSF